MVKYEDVVVEVRVWSYDAECIAVEVVSNGLIESKLQQLKDTLCLPAKGMTELVLFFSIAAILGSYIQQSWCSRNMQL